MTRMMCKACSAFASRKANGAWYCWQCGYITDLYACPPARTRVGLWPPPIVTDLTEQREERFIETQELRDMIAGWITH